MDDPFEKLRGKHPHMNVRFEPPAQGSRTGVLWIAGDLDSQTSQDVQEGILNLLGQMTSGSALVVDLKNVVYISSTGVGILTQSLTEAAKKGIAFRLRGLSSGCRMIFSALGLLQYFDIEEGSE